MVFDLTLSEFLFRFVIGLSLAGYYGLIAVGLTVVLGTLRVANFAHGGFYMLGAFATFLLMEQGVPYVAAIVGAILVLIVIAAIVERLFIKPLRGSAGSVLFELKDQLIVTLGLFFILTGAVRIFITPHPRSIRVPWGNILIPLPGGASVPIHRLIIFLTALLVLTLFWLFMNYTKTGTIVRATAENREVTSLMGVDTDKYMLLTFCIGIGMAGLAGGVVGPVVNVVYTMGLWPTLVGFFIIAIGGWGSYNGAIAGAFIVGMIEAYTTVFLPASYSRAGIFILFLVILVVRPGGLTKQEGIL